MADSSINACPAAARAQHDGAVERLARVLMDSSDFAIEIDQLPPRDVLARTALHQAGNVLAVIETQLEGQGFVTRTLPPV